MSDSRLKATVAYAIKHLEMETVSGELSRTTSDGIEARLRLPYLVEAVAFLPGDERLPATVVDKLCAARSRLFAKMLAHMAEHDVDIRAMLDRQKIIDAKRAQLVAAIEGMANQ